ncbi:MAG: Rossmann-like domain-containing protein [Desulfobacteraceae bacterium]
MKVLDDVISLLPDHEGVRDIRQGVFHTAVWTRHCGLAATLPRDALRQAPPMVQDPGFLLEKGCRELIQLVKSDHILEAAMGMATINSLLDVDPGSCTELNAADLIMEKGENKRVAIVGHFPFIPKVEKVAKTLWVVEKNPRPGDFSEDEAEKLIPRADVVGITGTAFTNHTIEHLLNLCDKGAYVVVLGDTAPLSPVLFDYGVNAVSGTKVMDPEQVLRCVSQGANYRQIKGVSRLTMRR